MHEFGHLCSPVPGRPSPRPLQAAFDDWLEVRGIALDDYFAHLRLGDELGWADNYTEWWADDFMHALGWRRYAIHTNAPKDPASMARVPDALRGLRRP